MILDNFKNAGAKTNWVFLYIIRFSKNVKDRKRVCYDAFLKAYLSENDDMEKLCKCFFQWKIEQKLIFFSQLRQKCRKNGYKKNRILCL